ncbi:response regulator transcription factor [Paenibacillus typhae]|uniref:Two-component response regulator, YesN/AraC family, consists of REC and AraC-type DNA-binding domains n=1 Tax=Paenibacillus typhae TaxID=1174501 RepID=A0A1G8FCA2_9BACL|nr:response regulator [Paenibacillus typhae]MBY0013502.1 response regulator [Paenibacillus typhae]SDH79682.1 Two-component response regulator, YesN/AraC family, consists of REC and AraC-type DNA-binding domains [Paenibacillus typhae]
MIKLAIVDDESLVRVGFQTIIDWQAFGYELHGVYRNGKEAWEAFCQNGTPDVLLTDIRMPEMDGLELIRHIRQADMDMIILVLSSYEEFEYTRKSIQLGVQDYIPKHLFDPEELIATLSRLTDKKKNAVQEQMQRSHSNALDEEKQRLMTHSRMLPGIIAPAVVMDPVNYPILSEMLKHTSSVRWVTIHSWLVNHSDHASDQSALGFLLQDLMNKTVYAVPLGVDRGSFHGLLFCDEQGQEEILMLTGLVKEWIDTVKQNLAITVVAGLSESRSFQECKMLRNQAEQMFECSFFKGPGLYRFELERDPDPEPIELQLQQWQQQFAILMKQASYTEFKKWLDVVGEELSRLHSPDTAFRLIQWMLKVYLNDRMDNNLLSGIDEVSAVPSPFFSKGHFLTWNDLKNSFLETVEHLEASAGSKPGRHPWLEPVFVYVKEHFADSIRLEEAAKMVNLNIHYFSHRFSQEMGMTFLEYVTQIRIRKSMQLIREFQLSAEEVASRVGYPNSNYFVKVFKKVTGMTVSEFKSSQVSKLN